jgi:hypothetical protein
MMAAKLLSDLILSNIPFTSLLLSLIRFSRYSILASVYIPET